VVVFVCDSRTSHLHLLSLWVVVFLCDSRTSHLHLLSLSKWLCFCVTTGHLTYVVTDSSRRCRRTAGRLSRLQHLPWRIRGEFSKWGHLDPFPVCRCSVGRRDLQLSQWLAAVWPYVNGNSSYHVYPVYIPYQLYFIYINIYLYIYMCVFNLYLPRQVS
jgi:hypothetical protein